MSPKNPILFKAHVMREFRKTLDSEGFLELSTPILRRHDDGIVPRVRLEDGRYLRDSLAFALRYNLALADKIYELGPSFRRDDADATHLPEFTMLDLYWAGAPLAEATALAERLVRLFYAGPIDRLSVAERIREDFGVDLFDDELGEQRLHQRLSEKYHQKGTPYDKQPFYSKMLDRYIREELEVLSKDKCLIMYDFPLVTEARAKRNDGAACVADRVEFQFDGLEVIHAYADEPDPSLLIFRMSSGRG